MPRTPRIEIEYCTQCRWLLRAAWMAQELLTTFEKDVSITFDTATLGAKIDAADFDR